MSAITDWKNQLASCDEDTLRMIVLNANAALKRKRENTTDTDPLKKKKVEVIDMTRETEMKKDDVETKEKDVEKHNTKHNTPCHICGNDFKYPSKLKRHQEKKSCGSSVQNTVCHTCGKAFPSPWKLKRHLNCKIKCKPPQQIQAFQVRKFRKQVRKPGKIKKDVVPTTDVAKGTDKDSEEEDDSEEEKYLSALSF